MLQFPETFFQAENRDGFLVNATMKTVWATQLEILNEIAMVCERHGLTWYMAFGSLLGTVRHQGFIPWDDDMDICMKRADYMKFLEVATTELPEGYVVKSPMLEEGYPEFHSCVMNSKYISIEPEHLRKFHNCPFIVGIDVFPLDYLSDEKDELQSTLFMAARQSALMVKKGEQGDKLEELFTLLEQQCGVTIDRKYMKNPNVVEIQEELAAGLWGLANEIAMWNGETETGRLVMYLDYARFGKVYETEWFDKIDWMSFEGFDVPVPTGYDRVLRVVYWDYTTPIQNAAMHDYPFYKKQMEHLRRRVSEVEAAQKGEK